MKKNIKKTIAISIIALELILLVFLNIDMIKGTDFSFLDRTFFIFQNIIFVTLVSFYLLISNKIYKKQIKYRVLFSIVVFIMFGLASSNVFESMYNFHDIKSMCSYWNSCNEKKIYYEDDNYFIFISDKYEIDILKVKNKKYHLIKKNVKYSKKNESTDSKIREFVYDIGDGNQLLIKQSPTELEDMRKLKLFDSEWEIINLYGIINYE